MPSGPNLTPGRRLRNGHDNILIGAYTETPAPDTWAASSIIGESMCSRWRENVATGRVSAAIRLRYPNEE